MQRLASLGREESAGNQRLKNVKNIRTFTSQVGTSETTRVTTNLKKSDDERFYE